MWAWYNVYRWFGGSLLLLVVCWFWRANQMEMPSRSKSSNMVSYCGDVPVCTDTSDILTHINGYYHRMLIYLIQVWYSPRRLWDPLYYRSLYIHHLPQVWLRSWWEILTQSWQLWEWSLSIWLYLWESVGRRIPLYLPWRCCSCRGYR